MSEPALPQCFLIGLPPHIDSGALPTEAASGQCGLNTGNLVAGYALSSHLDYPEVVDIGTRPKHMTRFGKIGVIQGANQLGGHFGGGRQFAPASEIEIDLAIVGLGIQGPIAMGHWSGEAWEAAPVVDDIPQDAVDWLGRIADRAPAAAPNIGVRGALTQAALMEHGFGNRVEVIGCPSLFTNPNPHLGQEIAAKGGGSGRVAVLAGHEGWTRLQPTEAALAPLVQGTDGSYIGQHGDNIMKITRGEVERLSHEALLKCRDYICPSLSVEEFKSWCSTYGNIFFNVPAWLEHYRRFDFVVGLRIHGTVLALQAGVPALCVAHDARMLELCQTMHIPHVLPAQIEPGITVEDLPKLAAFDAEAFDANRRALCRKYVNFLRNNGVTPVPWLEDIATPEGENAALVADTAAS